MKNVPENAASAQPDLAVLLQTHGSGKKSWLRMGLFLLGAICLGVVGWIAWHQKALAENAMTPYVTESLRRGDIRLSITATGNLEPTNEVTIGSELSGTVLEVYVDTNDTVTKGQPLAKLDTTKLHQQTESSRATLVSAKAQVLQAEATLRETEATLARHTKLRELSSGKVPAQAEMDSAVAAAARASADLAVAKAAVSQAEAQLSVNETDLGKAIIKSPIDGIVLTRTIEPGQTVAANFTAPELFVIAEKLEHMKLKVAVAEADIGRVSKGQTATFTVDAWPNRTYTAKVLKVAYGSSVTDNVVTYETELEVSNKDLSLRPGMTATADVHVAESKNAFLVPTAAFRFNPASAANGTGAVPQQQKTFVQTLMPGPPRPTANRRSTEGDTDKKPTGSPDGTARIWILRDQQPVSLSVKIGLSDGRHTEIFGDDVSEGLSVITRVGR